MQVTVFPALVLAVVFVAFSIWLGVRIYNRREAWAKRTAVALAGLLALYALSLLPACRLVAREDPDANQRHPWFGAIYWPIARCATAGPEEGLVVRAITWFAALALPKNSQVFIPDGTSEIMSNGVRAFNGISAQNQYEG